MTQRPDLLAQATAPIQHYCVFLNSDDSLLDTPVIYGPFSNDHEAESFGEAFGEEGSWFYAAGVIAPPV